MRTSSALVHLSTVVLFALGSMGAARPARAGESIARVSLGRAGNGDMVDAIVWTETGAASPERVQIDLSPFPGAPPLAGGSAVIGSPDQTVMLWQVGQIEFAANARGANLLAHISLWDQDGELVGGGELPVVAGALTCGQALAWSTRPSDSEDLAHAHLDLDASGSSGSMGIALSGPDAPRVAAVTVELQGSVALAKASPRRQAASLAVVQQRWSTRLVGPATAGDRYQVDGIVLDGQGNGFGQAFVDQVSVLADGPDGVGSCAWPPGHDHRLATR